MGDDLEQRVRDLERQQAVTNERGTSQNRAIEQILGTVELYGRLDERLTAQQDDLHQAHEAIRELGRGLDAEREERRRQVEEARAERNERFRVIETDRHERETELSARIQEATLATRRAMYALAATFITSLAGVVVAYLAQRGAHP